ncbi:hypothetical protein [Hymenobacter armeniacus]|uniref:Uncharacterized protein n=1 Tax=Hymenobacter armeniacus TaxID=2771358 RepID=A0ABR8JUG9_9BACT|nr:hypothetical protein [Hymenobacter armeniacus]MBD2721604.1 hypothetical protein [Hymenobacter armeniacus]
MHYSFLLLLGGCALLAGCGADEKPSLPVPAAGDNRSILRYQINGQTFEEEARVSYQPAAPPTRPFDVLNVEAGDSSRASSGAYVLVAFLKSAGRPDSNYGVVSIRYRNPTIQLGWGISPRGTLAQWNGGWRGSFSGPATDQLSGPRVAIEGEFINVR